MRRSNLPGNWIRSKAGLVAYAIASREGVRLRFCNGVTGSRSFTLRELRDEGVRWFKRRPRKCACPKCKPGKED